MLHRLFHEQSHLHTASRTATYSISRPRNRSFALFVVDAMERYDHMYGHSAMDNIKSLVESFRSMCRPVFFKTWYRPYGMAYNQVRYNIPHQNKTWSLNYISSQVYPISDAEEDRTCSTHQYSHISPALVDKLRERFIDTIVIVGGWSEHCITSVAFHAFNQEFDVVLIHDAIGPRASTRNRYTQSMQVTASGVAKLMSTRSFIINLRKTTKGTVCASTPFAPFHTRDNVEPTIEHVLPPFRISDRETLLYRTGQIVWNPRESRRKCSSKRRVFIKSSASQQRHTVDALLESCTNRTRFTALQFEGLRNAILNRIIKSPQ